MVSATQRRLSFGVTLVVLVASFSSPDAATEPATADIVMLQEEELMKPAPAKVYAEIPGFKFNFDAHPASVKDKGECQGICNLQPTCQSFSYSERLNTCEWSTAKMQYDPDFVFSFKGTDGQAYHSFPGLVYRATGWLKSEGKTQEECARLCDRAAACAAFSYRERDQLCLLSGHQVGFNEDFNYYEREGSHEEFPLRPKDGKHVEAPAPVAAAPVAAAPVAVPGAQPSAGELINAAVAAARAVVPVAPSAPAVVAGEPPSVVAERLEAVKEWAAQKIQQEKEEADLKIQAAKVDNEAALEKEKASDDQARVAEEQVENKAVAQKEAEMQAAEAKIQADNMVNKVKLEAEQASVTAELSQAAAEKQEAHAAMEKANKEVKTVKEADEKKATVAQQELKTKATQKADEEMQLQLVREKDAKSEQVKTSTRVAEATAQVRSEMSQKTKAALETTQERNVKMVDEEIARKSTRAAQDEAKQKELTKLKNSNTDLTTQLQAANQKTADALLSESKTKAEMHLAVEQAKQSVNAEEAANELEAKTTANESVQKAELARQRSDEQLRKESQVQSDMHLHAMEAAQKSSSDTEACQHEYEQMQQAAETEEQATANVASTMPAQEGNALLEQKKEEWRQKLLTKENQCIPKKVSFSVKVQPLTVASISAPRPEGPTLEEFLSLSETQEPPAEDAAPDPWALDRPVAKTRPDGTLVREDYADDNARLRDSNAAMDRGMQNIESGAAEQVAYYKFKIAELRSGEIVKEAKMSLRKVGGPESSCVVKLTRCAYDPNALTYATRPEVLNTISNGAMFPQADGIVNVPLDTTLITGYLTNEGAQDQTLCIELSGGLQNQPVTVDEVNVVLNIEKDPGVVDATERRRRTLPDVEVARRRRSELPEARRRRSIQAIKDQAKPIYDQMYAKWQPVSEALMRAKLPLAIAEREKEVADHLKAEEPAIVEAAIRIELDKHVNKDEIIERENAANKETMKEAVDRDVESRYNIEFPKLVQRMKQQIADQETENEEQIIKKQAEDFASDEIKNQGPTLLASALEAAVKKELPDALMQAVGENAQKDYRNALAAVVTPSVKQELESWIQTKRTDEINRRIKAVENAGETGELAAAANAAVNAKMEEVAGAVLESTRTELCLATPTMSYCTPACKQSPNSGNCKAGTVSLNAAVAAKASAALSAQQISAIKQTARTAKLEELTAEIQTTVPKEYPTPGVVEAKSKTFTQSEEDRLKPTVRADILGALEKDLTPGVTAALTKKLQAQQDKQKDAVLTRLRSAFVLKKKAELFANAQAGLADRIAKMTSDNSLFPVKAQAAGVALKENLRKEVEDQLKSAYEKITKSKIKEEEDEAREEIEDTVRAAKATELRATIATEMAKLPPLVQRDLQTQTDRELKLKVRAETKKEVDKVLGDELKTAVKHKYEESTKEHALAFVKTHRENVIREEEIEKMNKAVAIQVAAKFPTEKEKLKEEIVEQLKKSIFTSLKADGAEESKKQTEGLTPANAAAVELANDNRLQTEAAAQAETQATIKLESGKAKELEEQMTLQATNALKEGLEKKVEERVQAEAEAISQKSLEEKYRDDLDAMELGQNHVQPIPDDDQAAPNVVDAAAQVDGLAAATAAELTQNFGRGNATIASGNATAAVEATAATNPTGGTALNTAGGATGGTALNSAGQAGATAPENVVRGSATIASGNATIASGNATAAAQQQQNQQAGSSPEELDFRFELTS